MRDAAIKHLDHDPDFEWRGQSVSRLENLSDIVFALALGMLLLTGTPPQTYTELIHFLTGIVPVAAGFAILLLIWNAHFVFFRRYALADNVVVFLNSCLLLVVLFFAYPLRFIFDSLFLFIIASLTGDYSALIASEMNYQTSAYGVAIFGVGYAVLFALLSLMYGHALRKADLIGLNEDERTLTRRSIWMMRAQVVIAVIVAISAALTPLGAASGALMALNWPAGALIGRRIKPANSGKSATE